MKVFAFYGKGFGATELLGGGGPKRVEKGRASACLILGIWSPLLLGV